MSEIEATWFIKLRVDLEFESFWHEVARLSQYTFHADEKMRERCESIISQKSKVKPGRYAIVKTVSSIVIEGEFGS